MRIEQEVVTTTWIYHPEMPEGSFLENTFGASPRRFSPTQITIKAVGDQNRNGRRVVVRAVGPIVNKGGSLSSSRTQCEFAASDSATEYGRAPLTDMPNWLADLVVPYIPRRA